MSRLDRMQKSLKDMTREELIALQREIRMDRKVSKRVQKTTKKHTRAKAQEKARSLLAGLTPKDREALLATLRGDER